MAADRLGWTPADVDRVSFRDLWICFAGARGRERRRWEHTLYTIQAIINTVAKRPEPLDAIYRRAFKEPGKRMTKDQIRTAFSSIAVPADGV